MPNQRRPVRADLRRADPADDDQLRGTGLPAGARKGRSEDDDSGLPNAVRVVDRVRHAQGHAGGAGEGGETKQIGGAALDLCRARRAN